MATVKELIEYLETLPQDFTVCVIKEEKGDWGYTNEWDDLVIPDEHDYSPNVDLINTEVWLGERSN
jgi:hypothetical protein